MSLGLDTKHQMDLSLFYGCRPVAKLTSFDCNTLATTLPASSGTHGDQP